MSGGEDVGPYARTVWLWRDAGWTGVLPLPVNAKWPPPGGYTGWAGIEPSGADVQAWADGPEGAGNIALRLPVGVYGLDVDDYSGKSGGAALGQLVERAGPLPPTWVVSSRDDSISGIRLFHAELPAGRRWRDEPAGHGAGIEAIHFGHRYAVTWPSIHPDTGRKYLLRRPDGALATDGELPRPARLPALPDGWIEVTSQPGEVRTGEMAGHAEAITAVAGWRVDEACARMRAARARGLARLRVARDGAALHPAARDATQELVALGHEGHAGARATLAEHYSAFVEVRAMRADVRADARGKAEAEWWRLVRGAVGKLVGPARTACDCALLAGEGVQFEFEGGDEAASESPGVGGGLSGPLARRLLTPAQVRELLPPQTVVDGLLTMDSESWLIAVAGSYKTFVALDIAAHVAGGRPWMGRPVKAGPVLYLLAEGVGGLGKRVRAWEQRNGPMSTDMHFLTVPVQAGEEEQWAALVDLAVQMRPVLIVLDTQARLTVGIKENDNTDMGMWVHAVGRLRRAAGGCVLVVHHVGRSGQDARGASAIDGAQDSELKLTRTADKRVVLTTDKQRHLSDDARVELELFECALDDGGASLVVGAPLSSVPPRPDWWANLTLNQMTLADIMADIFPAVGATKAELKAEARKRPRRLTDGGALEPMGESAFRRAWDALVDSERIVRVAGVQRYVLSDVDVKESE